MIDEPAETMTAPLPRPRLVMMHRALPQGAFVTAEEATLYVIDEIDAWSLMRELIDPRLKLSPQGKC